MPNLLTGELGAAEVDAVDHRVHGGDGVRTRAYHRCVVAEPPNDPRTAGAEQLLERANQLELAHAIVSGALTVAVHDARTVEVIRRELDAHPVARQDPDPETPHLPCHVPQYDVVVVELDAEHRVGEGLDDLALELDLFFLGHRGDPTYDQC